MTQEQKDLLLKDLSARLSYGVICNTSKGNGHLCSINQTIFGIVYGINIKATERDYFNDRKEIIKPYLRPISSMTEEQKKELENLGWNFDNFEIHNVNECFGTYREYVAHSDCSTLIDWLNRHHFDYRRLIKKGLAIDATSKNIY